MLGWRHRVVSPKCRCITTWLPRRRTSTNPWSLRILQTSLPESRRSLPNLQVEVGYVNLAMESFLDLASTGRLEEEDQGFTEVAAGFLNRVPLAGDIQLGAKGNEPVPLAFDQSRQVLGALHPPIIGQAG